MASKVISLSFWFLCACCLAIACLTPSIAFARIGESRANCDRRYGRPTKTYGSNKVDYTKNGIGIHCVFSGSTPGAVCEHIIYNSGLTAPISDKQVTDLLQANSGGKSWGRPITENGPFGSIITWKRTDGAIATYSFEIFNVRSARLMKKDSDAERDGIRGF